MHCFVRVLLQKIEHGDSFQGDTAQNVLAALNPFSAANRASHVIIERNEPVRVNTAPTLKSLTSDMDTLHSLRDWHSEQTNELRSMSAKRAPKFAHPVPQAKQESLQVIDYDQ